jgi:hypothetical protein
MTASSDEVLERARVREVAAIFHSRAALDEANDALLLAGFDRSDIDCLAELDQVYGELGSVYVAAEDLADISRVPRQPVIEPEDVTGARAVIVGIIAVLGAGAAAFAVLASNGGMAAAVVAALAAAAVAGGIGVLVTARLFRSERSDSLEADMAARGIILWVRLRSPEREEKAQQILRNHGGRAIRTHEIEIDKRPQDLPLSKLRPDPWLGSERLGQP